MFKSVIILSITYWALAWLEHSHIQELMLTVLPANLSHFASAMTFNPTYLIITGGLSSLTYSNRTFFINLSDNTTKEILPPSGPEPRLDPCCHISSNYMFLTGGRTKNQTKPRQLWRLDLTANKWQMVLSVQYLVKCSMYSLDNDTIILTGITQQQTIGVNMITLSTLSVKPLSVTVGSRAQVESVLWDGTIVNTTVPIEKAPEGALLVEESQLQIDFGAFHLADSLDPSVKFLSANSNIYSMTVTSAGADLKYIGPGWQESGQLQSVNDGQWNIACGLVNGLLQMEFNNLATFKKVRVSKNSSNYYGPYWPDFTGTHHFSIIIIPKTFTGLPGFAIILHNSYKTYILHKNVYLAIPPTPIGLKETYFGINTCLPGWRLPYCNTSACPNSLLIQSQFLAINFQCSGHGICREGVCVCDQNWGGDDCRIYQRKSCAGTRLSNFPLENCECMDPTLGGPDCSVKFCPNGCSGHGQCKEGTCECKTDYSGADCSIMIVGFPT